MILVATPLDAERRADLETDFDLVFLPETASRARGLLVDGGVTVDAALIDGLPDLEIIASIGTGYDRIDLAACQGRGVAVVNTAGANADAVAELAIGLIISVMRGLGEGERLLRAGRWRGDQPRRFFEAPGLTGRRLGILGMGAIGRQLARRLSGFDLEIAWSGPRAKPDLPYRYVNTLVSLAGWADILVLAHRADDTNGGLVDSEVLSALGPDGYLINVSRGSAVDEAALARALEDGLIAGAALDVFDGEPQASPALLALDRLVLTPHIGGGSRQAFERMFQAVGNDLRAHFAGRPLANAVLEPRRSR